jgi:predicted  nucleic acid-binding Zn-ribbon protein
MASTLDVDLDGLAFKYDEAKRKCRDIVNRRNSALSDADRELAEEVAALEVEIEERDGEIKIQNGVISDLQRRQGAAENGFRGAKKELKAAVDAKRAAIRGYIDEQVVALAKLASHPERVFGPANPFYGKRLKYAGKPEEALAHYKVSEDDAAATLRELTPDKLSRMASFARNRMIDNYCRPNGIERPYSEEAPYHWDYTWVVRQLERLEKNELREHLERITRAEKEMVNAIKEDLLSRLTDKFDRLDDQLKALNSHLSHHEFTGQVYQFGRRADPAFDKMRKLAVAVRENPDHAQAIIEKRHEDPALIDAMHSLEEYIDAKGGAGLEDYRNYYSFDLYMVPKGETGGDPDKVKGRMSLSARVGVASGGEAQAPFYVAMAASMAMAYYPGGHPGPVPSGMGLVIFDEAFSKLDVVNTQALILFYASLGLQLLVAAPEGERPTFTEVFDTIVTVSKSAATKTVYIASDFPKDRTRQELAAINPTRKGVEGFRAELEAAE